jgi:hypothetical protein
MCCPDQAKKDSQAQQDASKIEELKGEAEQQRQEYVRQLNRMQEEMASLQVQTPGCG